MDHNGNAHDAADVRMPVIKDGPGLRSTGLARLFAETQAEAHAASAGLGASLSEAAQKTFGGMNLGLAKALERMEVPPITTASLAQAAARIREVNAFTMPPTPPLPVDSNAARTARSSEALVVEGEKQRAMLAQQQRLLAEQQALTLQLVRQLEAAAEREAAASRAEDRRFRIGVFIAVVVAFLSVAFGVVLGRLVG